MLVFALVHICSIHFTPCRCVVHPNRPLQHNTRTRFSQVVCDLIEEEAEAVGGSEHVMLAGFSQGGALALHIAVHSGIQ